MGAPDQLVKHLSHIERSGKHLLQMVSGILDLSKMDAGRFEVSLGQVDVQLLLKDATEPLVELARKTGVGLELSPYEGEPELLGDGLRLKQVLINLIGNAIKFSAGRGSDPVRVRRKRRAHVRFSVSDQGIGIAPENREKIFRSFEQVDQGDTRRYGGTGLGLSISKSLVELHGGEIGVESVARSGQHILVQDPAGRTQPPHSRAARTPDPSRGRRGQRRLRLLRSSRHEEDLNALGEAWDAAEAGVGAAPVCLATRSTTATGAWL